MSYLVESSSAARARKRRQTALVLLVVISVFAGGFMYAASYWKHPPTEAASCTSTSTQSITTQPPDPGHITVNVYNSTTRKGLAKTTADALKTLGFVVGTVANDPLDKGVTAPAEIRFGKNGQEASIVVSRLVTGAVPVVDTRADASVDLVLGTAFRSLQPSTASPTNTPNSPKTC